jgi:hypothetical protein
MSDRKKIKKLEISRSEMRVRETVRIFRASPEREEKLTSCLGFHDLHFMLAYVTQILCLLRLDDDRYRLCTAKRSD